MPTKRAAVKTSKKPRGANPERDAITKQFVEHALTCTQCRTVVLFTDARSDGTVSHLCAYGRRLHEKDRAAVVRGLS